MQYVSFTVEAADGNSSESLHSHEENGCEELCISEDLSGHYSVASPVGSAADFATVNVSMNTHGGATSASNPAGMENLNSIPPSTEGGKVFETNSLTGEDSQVLKYAQPTKLQIVMNAFKGMLIRLTKREEF